MSETTGLLVITVALALVCLLLGWRLLENRQDRLALALAAAERDYRSIFDNAIDGIYRSSPSGRQLRAGKGTTASIRLPPERLAS